MFRERPTQYPRCSRYSAGRSTEQSQHVCVEIHSSSIVDWEEDRHPTLAGNIELPFGYIGMPVEFAHATRLLL